MIFHGQVYAPFYWVQQPARVPLSLHQRRGDMRKMCTEVAEGIVGLWRGKLRLQIGYQHMVATYRHHDFWLKSRPLQIPTSSMETPAGILGSVQCSHFSKWYIPRGHVSGQRWSSYPAGG
jgi:hypothetical protein